MRVHFRQWLTVAGAVTVAVGVLVPSGVVSAAPITAAPLAATAPENRDTGHGAPTPKDRPPRSSSSEKLREPYGKSHTLRAAGCSTADFTSRTGAALVSQIGSSTTDCINTLFPLTGTDARLAFKESQMATVAYALRDNASTYPGDNSTSTAQLVLYLRAGYYAHWYHASDVGTYGSALATAIRAGLDAFFASPRSIAVNDGNGEVLAEAVTLIDSAEENARYLYVVKRMLDGYTSAYDGYWWMLTAVNNVYTVLFRGHQNTAFVSAVTADPGVLDTLNRFASGHIGLLGTDRGYLTSNAGRELARFLQHPALLARTRPLARGLLDRSSIRGATAPLWVGVAEMADSYDQANCSYYSTCDLRDRLAAEVLPITYTCGASIRIRAQEMTAGQLSSTCTSLVNQDSYFHGVVTDPGPVANDRNTTIEVVVFDSSTDYQTYAGVMFGVDTNNGGIYLEGDPAAAGNQPRFIAYEAEWLRPAFQIWNLNHEYTHYLDGRFDMSGDFDAGMSTPTVWWIEGFAEYVSYSYRGAAYPEAVTEAGRRTYALSTLFDTTYDNDTTRVYRWGYLAVRYMLQSHRGDMNTVLGYYRTGNWSAARTYLTNTIGTRYNTDWYAWLTSCAAGNCGGTTQPAQCTGASNELGKNCQLPNRGTTAGNYDYMYVYIPAATASLKITTTDGTGDCDLLYNADSWATLSTATSRSAHPGNTETLTITAPPTGYHYVSLYGHTGCSGVAVTSVAATTATTDADTDAAGTSVADATDAARTSVVATTSAAATTAAAVSGAVASVVGTAAAGADPAATAGAAGMTAAAMSVAATTAAATGVATAGAAGTTAAATTDAAAGTTAAATTDAAAGTTAAATTDAAAGTTAAAASVTAMAITDATTTDAAVTDAVGTG
jgi:microbial collagenase